MNTTRLLSAFSAITLTLGAAPLFAADPGNAGSGPSQAQQGAAAASGDKEHAGAAGYGVPAENVTGKPVRDNASGTTDNHADKSNSTTETPGQAKGVTGGGGGEGRGETGSGAQSR